MKKYPNIFIIILNYNRREYLKKCLDSVFRIAYPDFEVVLVDNNSNDGSLEMARAGYSRSVFIKNEENLGFSAGNNVGIKYALERMADWVLLLNNDTRVKSNFLSALVETAESDPEIGIASPLIFDGHTGKVWFSGGKIDWLRMKTVHQSEIKAEDNFATDFISGCAMMVKKDVFQKIGLLDEDFFLYWEDADFSWRAKKAGFKTAVSASSWIDHFERKDGESGNKIYWLVLSGLMFFQKNTHSFFLKSWISLYTRLRRIKNLIDVELRKSKSAKLVQKAYEDFSRLRM
jgi:GT2 family glycosyltransferase